MFNIENETSTIPRNRASPISQCQRARKLFKCKECGEFFKGMDKRCRKCLKCEGCCGKGDTD